MTVRRHHYSATTPIAMIVALLLALLPVANTGAFEPGDANTRTNVKVQDRRARLSGIVSNSEQARQVLSAQRDALNGLLDQSSFTESDRKRMLRRLERIDKALLYLEIASSTGARRHELIRQLPVTVTSTRAEDGRPGAYREYASNGKVRIKVFVPDAALSTVATSSDADAEQPDGSTFDGRLPPVDCYYEDEDGSWSGPCVTQQDVDDAFIVEADLLAGEDDMVADAEEAHDEIYDWCQNNYPACEGEEAGAEDVRPSGPSIGEHDGLEVCLPDEGPWECMALGVGAVQEAGYAVASRVKLSNLVRSGQIMTVTASALAWKVALAVGSVAAAAIFINASWECFMEI